MVLKPILLYTQPNLPTKLGKIFNSMAFLHHYSRLMRLITTISTIMFILGQAYSHKACSLFNAGKNLRSDVFFNKFVVFVNSCKCYYTLTKNLCPSSLFQFAASASSAPCLSPFPYCWFFFVILQVQLLSSPLFRCSSFLLLFHQ